jgi:hypothetical protein
VISQNKLCVRDRTRGHPTFVRPSHSCLYITLSFVVSCIVAREPIGSAAAGCKTMIPRPDVTHPSSRQQSFSRFPPWFARFICGRRSASAI